MLRFIVSVFIVLHGMAHLLYFGQSRRLFELQAGMVWHDGSWAFSKFLGEDATRWRRALPAQWLPSVSWPAS